jgi:Pyocin activator protein PrtN
MPSAWRDDIERQFSSISGQWAPHGTGGLKSGNFIQKFPPAAPSLRNANACLLLGLPIIPVDVVCRDYFHITVEKFLRKVLAGEISLPIVQPENR